VNMLICRIWCYRAGGILLILGIPFFIRYAFDSWFMTGDVILIIGMLLGLGVLLLAIADVVSILDEFRSRDK